MSFLLLGKQRDDFYFKKAQDFLCQHFPDTEVVLARPGESFPEAYRSWKGDYLISYLCPWIIPKTLLEGVRVASINFHPGPPEYPGTGCTNFALYHDVKVYGVTCHYMAPVVDSGKIVAVRRFPVFPADTVYSLTQRCYAYMLVLFYDVISLIIQGQPLPEAGETWKRKAYRRVELEELKRIEADMSPEEIRRRIRAVTYPGYPGAYTEINGIRFEYPPEADQNL